MHVAVSIVTFRNVDDIVVCLKALSRSTYADFEVLICENGGREAFERMKAAIPAKLPGGQVVRVVLSPVNVGYAAGVNRCMREVPDADAWWVLNPDTEPHVDALKYLVERLDVGDCDLVGGTVYTAGGLVELRAGGWRPMMGRTFSIGQGDQLDGPFDAAAIEGAAAYVSGACMLVSRRFVETAGFLREDFFLYCEEVEWCLRGKDAAGICGRCAGLAL
jgi:N-acetylglucosaminyl-diphospho-decaprenol L-rhamnosyltransferase